MKPSLPFMLLSLCAVTFSLFSQEIQMENEHDRDALHPCISEVEYTLIEAQIQKNARTEVLNDREEETVAMQWPLRAAENLEDCSYYRVSAYVDHNSASGAYQDYDCGTNTYDGHRGTDIASWPFNFHKMDNDLVEVVAAAPGTIIDKHDGEFDRNCGSNNLTANYIIIQHADNSVALYWHMKSNSVTPLSIGQMVAAGDYLGVVGASGSASGPHLHFEVWSGTTAATRVDPFAGSCNALNATSWWTTQKPHKETEIIKMSVNTTDIVLPGCPTTETLNESNLFVIPFQGPQLAPGYAKFYMFIRDEVQGLTATASIVNPDGSAYLSWTYASTSTNPTHISGWSKVLPTAPGVYTFRGEYNGLTCETQFEISAPTGIASLRTNQTTIYPNPSNGNFTLETEMKGTTNLLLYNSLGALVSEIRISNPKTSIQFQQPKGMYWFQLVGQQNVLESGKLEIE